MSGVGTLAKGGFSSVTRRTVLNFQTPAGRKHTLLTYKEAEQNPERELTEMHGDGGVAAYALAKGHGTLSFSGSMAQHEWAQIVAIAGAAGLAIGDLVFSMVTSDVLDGIPKDAGEMIGCQLESWAETTASDGTMVEISGKALNRKKNGVWDFPLRK